MVQKTTIQRLLGLGVVALGVCEWLPKPVGATSIPVTITAEVDPTFRTGDAVALFDVNDPIELFLDINIDAPASPGSNSHVSNYGSNSISGCSVKSGSHSFGCEGNSILIGNTPSDRNIIYITYFLDSVPESQRTSEFQSFATISNIPKDSTFISDASLSSAIEAFDSPSFLSSFYSQMLVVLERGSTGFTKGVVSSWITDTEVGNSPPIANAGGPYVFDANTLTVSLDGSGSSDPNDDITVFQWQDTKGNFIQRTNEAGIPIFDPIGNPVFDIDPDANVRLSLADASLSAPTLHADGTKIDPSAPVQQVTLTVVDEAGLIDSDNATVEYQNALPSILSFEVEFDINRDFNKPFLERMSFKDIVISDVDVDVFSTYEEKVVVEYSTSPVFGENAFRTFEITPTNSTSLDDAVPLPPFLFNEFSAVDFVQRFNSLPGDKTMWVNVKDSSGDVLSHEVTISLPDGVVIDTLKNATLDSLDFIDLGNYIIDGLSFLVDEIRAPILFALKTALEYGTDPTTGAIFGLGVQAAEIVEFFSKGCTNPLDCTVLLLNLQYTTLKSEAVIQLNDPPRNDFTTPTAFKGDIEIDLSVFSGSPFEGGLVNYFTTFEHLNERFLLSVVANERYQGALLAGDNAAANLQLGYYEEHVLEAQALSRQLNSLLPLLLEFLDLQGLGDIALDSTTLIEFQDQVRISGIPQEIIELLLGFGFSQDNIPSIELAILSSDISEFSGTVSEGLTKSSMGFSRFGSASIILSSQMVSEPRSTAIFIIISFFILAYAKRVNLRIG